MRKLSALPILLLLTLLALPALGEDKVTICHAAGLDGTTHYETLTIGYPAVYGPGGHFNENGTPQAGHEQDYLGECEEETSTTPSSTTTTTVINTTTTETTVPPSTTTTTEQTTTTTLPVTTTNQSSTTGLRTLPLTGVDSGMLVFLALGLGSVGLIMVRGTRAE